MIEINLIVPFEDRVKVDNKASDTFCIITSYKDRTKSKRFYVVRTTKEEMTFLTLRYGRENVWKR